jgi:hypothetical protein
VESRTTNQSVETAWAAGAIGELRRPRMQLAGDVSMISSAGLLYL